MYTVHVFHRPNSCKNLAQLSSLLNFVPGCEHAFSCSKASITLQNKVITKKF